MFVSSYDQQVTESKNPFIYNEQNTFGNNFELFATSGCMITVKPKLINKTKNYDGIGTDTRGYQKVLSLTWKEPEIWIYSALFFNVVPFQLHTLVPSSFPVINTRSVEVNILVP